jgi:septum formation protein
LDEIADWDSILTQQTLLLASGSPRRAQILESMGLSFEVQTFDVDETPDPTWPAAQVPENLARRKLEVAARAFPEHMILAADTLILARGNVIGKPTDRKDARLILESFRGNNHSVLTGVAVRTPMGQIKSATAETKVYFREFQDRELESYLDTLEWQDKAGAYGIQGYGARLIQEIHGCFYNVMGLPIDLTFRLLQENAL